MARRTYLAPHTEELDYLLGILSEVAKTTRCPRHGITPEDALKSVWKNTTQIDALKDLGLPAGDSILSEFLHETLGIDVKAIQGPGCGTVKGKLLKHIKLCKEREASYVPAEVTNRQEEAKKLLLQLRMHNLLLKNVDENDIESVLKQLEKRAG